MDEIANKRYIMLLAMAHFERMPTATNHNTLVAAMTAYQLALYGDDNLPS